MCEYKYIGAEHKNSGVGYVGGWTDAEGMQ